MRGQWTIPGGIGELWQPYLRGNLWRDWAGRATTSFAGDAVPLVEQAWRSVLRASRRARPPDEAGDDLGAFGHGVGCKWRLMARGISWTKLFDFAVKQRAAARATSYEEAAAQLRRMAQLNSRPTNRSANP